MKWRKAIKILVYLLALIMPLFLLIPLFMAILTGDWIVYPIVAAMLADIVILFWMVASISSDRWPKDWSKKGDIDD